MLTTISRVLDLSPSSSTPIHIHLFRKIVTDRYRRRLILVRIGSGTGIFTRAMLAHPSFAKSVKELKAVEPSEGMRNFFIKSTVETDPEKRVSVREGTFDRTGIEDGVADMIVIAQVRVYYADVLP